jgi:hypothetical protein
MAAEAAPGLAISGAAKGIEAGVAQGQADAMNKAAMQDISAYNAQEDQKLQQAEQLGGQIYGGLGGGKGLGMAEGGGVQLEEGQFVIPADVVSALGNGSTKAGAAFLNEFFGVS